MVQKLILSNHQCPGDVMCMTACVESLHIQYPNRFQTDVRTTAWEIWEHNPRITPIASDDSEATHIKCEYPAVHSSNKEPRHMMDGFCAFLAEQLKIDLQCRVNHPVVYLSDEEKGWVNQVRDTFTGGRNVKYWLINAGSKVDMPAKQWPVEYYQQVVDATHGQIQWVQIGASEHNHPQLHGVLDLRGKTDTRQLIRLAYHAEGGLGGITFLMHLMAAVRKPYVCMAGGREPLQWIQYPLQHTFHSLGQLNCCLRSACWKSKVVGDTGSLCEQPVYTMQKAVGKCMAMITPQEVVHVLQRFQCVS